MFEAAIERRMKPRLKEIYHELAAIFPKETDRLKHTFCERYGFEEEDFD